MPPRLWGIVRLVDGKPRSDPHGRFLDIDVFEFGNEFERGTSTIAVAKASPRAVDRIDEKLPPVGAGMDRAGPAQLSSCRFQSFE